MEIQDIMMPKPACCTPDTGLERVAKLMCDRDCGEIPVVESLATMKVIGVITDRDIVCRTLAVGKNPLKLTARDCMTTPVVTITPNTSLEDCFSLMEANQIRRVPVVDEEQSCLGIVSQADLAIHAPHRQTAEFLAEVSRPLGSSA
jgi:CBS domain-containing protein